MKKIFNYFFLFFIIISTSFLYSCNKDTDCKAVITVRYLSNKDIVPGATVRIEKYDNKVSGSADAHGEFRHTYDLEAILDVIASIDSSGVPMGGTSVIRLKSGETVNQVVYIE